MDKNTKIIFIIFFIALIFYSIFSTMISYHDSPEYITIAKNFAGIDNVDLFTAHSQVYPFVISFFLRIWPSELMLRLINVTWIFLMSIALYFHTKNKNVLLLFCFSPIVWIVGIQTTPVLPASFFFLMSYIFFNDEKIKYNYLFSGIFGGLSFAFYEPMIIVCGIFLIVYFWDKQFRDFFNYGLGFFISSLILLIQNYILFHNPFYSLIRYFGANVLIAIGARESENFGVVLYKPTLFIPLIIIISPFIYTLYRTNFKQYRKEFIFIFFVILFFLIRIYDLKYFFILTPILLLILEKKLKFNEIKIHCILSIIIMLIFTFNSFGQVDEALIKKDLESIKIDYPEKWFLTYSFQANNLAVYSWDDEPRFIWFSDYDAYLNNKTIMKSYEVDSPSKINLRENLKIKFDFERPSNIDYNNLNYLIARKRHMEGIKNTTSLDDFVLIKCYEELCVYGKENEELVSRYTST